MIRVVNMPRRQEINITHEVTVGPPPWLKPKVEIAETSTLVNENSGMKISDIKD